MTIEKKPVAIRLEYNNYTYIKDLSSVNKRTIGGQLDWIIQVHFLLKEKFPDIYISLQNTIEHNNN